MRDRTRTLPGAVGARVRHRRDRLPGPPQRADSADVHRADAELGEPDAGRVQPLACRSNHAGQIFAFFVIAVAAAEAAVGLAIVISLFRLTQDRAHGRGRQAASTERSTASLEPCYGKQGSTRHRAVPAARGDRSTACSARGSTANGATRKTVHCGRVPVGRAVVRARAGLLRAAVHAAAHGDADAQRRAHATPRTSGSRSTLDGRTRAGATCAS